MKSDLFKNIMLAVSFGKNIVQISKENENIKVSIYIPETKHEMIRYIPINDYVDDTELINEIQFSNQAFIKKHPILENKKFSNNKNNS